MEKIGVITEIGDMGLGFEELNNKDQKIVKEAYYKEKDNKKDEKQKK